MIREFLEMPKTKKDDSIIAVAEMLIERMRAAGIALNEDSFVFEQYSYGPVFSGPSATWYAWSYPGRFQLIKWAEGEKFTLVLSREFEDDEWWSEWDFFASEKSRIIDEIVELDEMLFKEFPLEEPMEEELH